MSSTKPDKAQAEAAVRTLISYAGDDPDREGVLGTPDRVARAWKELFNGYAADPHGELERTFEEIEGYNDIVLLKDIRFESHCEHHIMPFVGIAHVAYLPNNRVVGISKLARVVEIYARRLQSQEIMTMQIADAIDQALQPKGVAVIIEAEHYCMSMRGIHRPGVKTITRKYTGAFFRDSAIQANLHTLIK